MKGRYRIAEHIVEILSLYEYVHRQCVNYRYTGIGQTAVRIVTAQSDLDFEREKSQEKDASDDYLESLAVYRKFAQEILNDGFILVHASAIAVDGQAYLFMAGSGIGKSTHTKLWMDYFGDRAFMVNDDKPIIKVGVCPNPAVVLGTPWDGKHRRSTNAAVPLKAICLLKRWDQNSIVKVSADQAYPQILQHCLRQKNHTKMELTLNLLDQLTDQSPLYQLYCNMEQSAVTTAYWGMQQ